MSDPRDERLSTSDLVDAGDDAGARRTDQPPEHPADRSDAGHDRHGEDAPPVHADIDAPIDEAARHAAAEPAEHRNRTAAAEPAEDGDDTAAATPAADTALGEEPLVSAGEAADYRQRWEQIQIGFVDSPRQAVAQADELVASVMRQLAETFATERARLEAQWDRGDEVGTEELRMALQRYRAFFNRLLST